QLEKIAMRFARRRARPTITNSAKVVSALPRPISKLLLLCHPLLKFSGIRRQIEQHPMHPRARRGIWIVHDERKALRLSGRLVPIELRRCIRPIAGEFLRDHFVGREGRAGNFHASSLGLHRWICAKEKGEAQGRSHKSSEQVLHTCSVFYFDAITSCPS